MTFSFDPPDEERIRKLLSELKDASITLSGHLEPAPTKEETVPMDESDFYDLLKYKLIRDMSKEELVAELSVSWTEELLKQDIGYLKQQVISLRMSVVKDRMIREAGLKQAPGFMGFPRLVEDDE